MARGRDLRCAQIQIFRAVWVVMAVGPLVPAAGCSNAEAQGPEPPDRAADRAELREAMACWARGMDLTIAGEGDGGQAEWDRCYAAPDYSFTVLFRGQVIEGDGSEGRRITNVQTAGMFGYVQAQHYVTNFDIDIAGDTASVVALQRADHFLPDPNLTVETTWGVITVQFRRDESGWRATNEQMDIQRFVAFPGVMAPSVAPNAAP